jgi:hypothetical protein
MEAEPDGLVLDARGGEAVMILTIVHRPYHILGK